MEKQIAVYTCLIGAYDDLFKIDNIYKEDYIADYYYITDNKNLKVKGYKMIYVDIIDNDNKITNRYYKIKMPEFIRKYKYSIYYDGNVKIINKLSELLNNVRYHDIAVFSYGIPFNVYMQFFFPFFGCYLKKPEMKKLYNKYINEGWKDNKLNSANKFIIKKHSPYLFYFLDYWYLQTKITKRDEFCLFYCVWKHNIKLNIINFLQIFKYFIIFYHRSEVNANHNGFNNIISPSSFSNIKKILLANRFFDKILNIIYISIFNFFNILLQFIYFLIS